MSTTIYYWSVTKLGKSRRVQFYCPKDLLTHLNKQAAKYCGGNRSEYLRHLVLQDMRTPGPMGPMPPGPQQLHMQRVVRERETETTLQVVGYGADHTAVLQELKTNALFQKCQAEAAE